jgi:hypothetical protein
VSGFIGRHGTQDRYVQDEAYGNQRSLNCFTANSNEISISGGTLQNENSSVSGIGQAHHLFEQSPIHDGAGKIRQRFSFEQDLSIGEVVSRPQSFNANGHPVEVAEAIDYIRFRLTVVGDDFDRFAAGMAAHAISESPPITLTHQREGF